MSMYNKRNELEWRICEGKPKGKGLCRGEDGRGYEVGRFQVRRQ